MKMTFRRVTLNAAFKQFQRLPYLPPKLDSKRANSENASQISARVPYTNLPPIRPGTSDQRSLAD
jgi:hypothetical protein